MTALDSILSELATRIRALSKRSVVGLFWSCSSALVPAFEAWAAHRGEATEPILTEALTVAYGFAAFGTEPTGVKSLLEALELWTPAGDAPDDVSSTFAQDCWICADVATRTLADSNYDSSPAIEYALEPVVTRATEDLFGVSQVGKGADESGRVKAILGHPAVASGIEFCRWATSLLAQQSVPTPNELERLRSGATALAP